MRRFPWRRQQRRWRCFIPWLAEVTETVGQAVIENQSAEIAVESENPHSAQAILDAVAACLEQAER